MAKNKVLGGLALALSLLGGCQSDTDLQTSKNHIVRVGTNAEFAPFCFVQDGKITGFDIELCQAVFDKLQRPVVVQDMGFEMLIPALQHGQVDIVAAGMTPTPERCQKAAFTTLYLSGDPLVVLVRPGVSIRQLEGLRDLRVVVNDGYTADQWATETFGLMPMRLAAPLDAILALQANQADAFITSSTSAHALSRSALQHTFSRALVIPETGESCAMMLRLSDTELLQEVNRALEDMRCDGTVTMLMQKWNLQ